MSGVGAEVEVRQAAESLVGKGNKRLMGGQGKEESHVKERPQLRERGRGGEKESGQ